MLEHGGNLHDAIRRFGRSRADWLDLSTGINPVPYPVPTLAADSWHRLPEADPALLAAALAFYDAPHGLPVAGSQAAIQVLPGMRAPCRVVIAAPAYAEHAHRWRQAGHQVSEVAYADLERALSQCDVMVVCNPNNPTGARVAPALLLGWAAQLASRDGWLVVDEAFADTTPHLSVASSAAAGMIVLRSVGKFFGLAGLRLGFVLAAPTLLAALAELIGPWSVSGPAQQIGAAALADRAWQMRTRATLLEQGERLRALLIQHDIEASGSALYQWWPEPHSEAFQHHFAERGIWVRRFAAERQGARGIRLGLPGTPVEWQRLAQGLTEWRMQVAA